MLEDTRYEPCFEDGEAADRAVGDDGIDMANLPDSPLHRIFITLMGYEAGSLAFADRPREMDDLCRLIFAKNEEAYAIAMKSPAEVLLTGENTNSDFESPDLFGRHAFPTLKRASGLAHAAWKGAITIDGGIPPHLLVGDGRNFVLSVSDDTPVDAAIGRLPLGGRGAP